MYPSPLLPLLVALALPGGRAGGSITAALFLKEFVKEGVEWAHLDIAGPVWDEKAGLPTGYGATTLAAWAAAQGA